MTCPNIVKERPDLNTLEIKNSWNYVNNGTIIQIMFRNQFIVNVIEMVCSM